MASTHPSLDQRQRRRQIRFRGLRQRRPGERTGSSDTLTGQQQLIVKTSVGSSAAYNVTVNATQHGLLALFVQDQRCSLCRRGFVRRKLRPADGRDLWRYFAPRPSRRNRHDVWRRIRTRNPKHTRWTTSSATDHAAAKRYDVHRRHGRLASLRRSRAEFYRSLSIRRHDSDCSFEQRAAHLQPEWNGWRTNALRRRAGLSAQNLNCNPSWNIRGFAITEGVPPPSPPFDVGRNGVIELPSA